MDTRKTHAVSKKLTGTGKTRLHISLTEPMARAVNFLGMQLFGSRNGFVEHALINALEAKGITVDRILELAAQWQKENTTERMEGGE